MAKKDEIKEGTLNPNEGKLKALQAAMAKIEKDFGKGSIMKLGDEHIENIEVIPTGSIALDMALGVGGYPRDESLKSMVRNLLVRPHLPSMPSQRLRSWRYCRIHRCRACLRPFLCCQVGRRC